MTAVIAQLCDFFKSATTGTRTMQRPTQPHIIRYREKRLALKHEEKLPHDVQGLIIKCSSDLGELNETEVYVRYINS